MGVRESCLIRPVACECGHGSNFELFEHGEFVPVRLGSFDNCLTAEVGGNVFQSFAIQRQTAAQRTGGSEAAIGIGSCPWPREARVRML